MTTGGATSVRIPKNTLNIVTIIPRRLSKLPSVILTALAERTRNITDILQTYKCISHLFPQIYANFLEEFKSGKINMRQNNDNNIVKYNNKVNISNGYVSDFSVEPGTSVRV